MEEDIVIFSKKIMFNSRQQNSEEMKFPKIEFLY